MTVLLLTHRDGLAHDMGEGHPECPDRLRAVLQALDSEEFADLLRDEPEEATEEQLTRVHPADYVAAILGIRPAPGQRIALDADTVMSSGSARAALLAAGAAVRAVDEVCSGQVLRAFCATRPPGHHAERRIYGGFCFLNNSAIAAHYLSKHGTVALLDIDYHHGNGGEDIFYARSDVLTVSIHGHPSHAYPNFSGYADERGEGVGLGFNHNFPLEPPVDDDRYLIVLDRALGVIRNFKPRFLVLSIGFDIMRGDPTGSFALTNAGMQRIGKRIGRFGLPTLIVQEGGYALGNLRSGSHAFFRGISEAWHD